MNDVIQAIIRQCNQVIVGKPQQVKLALACLLANGHLLIEDIPGTGKTTLAHTLALSIGLMFQRVQFTSDMLPADVLGVSIYDKDSKGFTFKPGAVFTQVLLADEINRASPKAQSALLEAMEEKQVTMDGITHALPQPFFVIATQNPQYHSGTFALPESQLDRFLMRISLGYPEREAELAILRGDGGRSIQENIKPVCSQQMLLQLQKKVQSVHVSESILTYIINLVNYSREQLAVGLSTRASLGILSAAQAWALCDDRAYVTPEDIQAVFSSVALHRLSADRPNIAQQILDQVAI